MATFTEPNTVSTALEIFSGTQSVITALSNVRKEQSALNLNNGLKNDIDDVLRSLVALLDQTRVVIENELPAVP